MINPELKRLLGGDISLRGESLDQVQFLVGAGPMIMDSRRFTEVVNRFPYGLSLGALGRALLGTAAAILPTFGLAATSEGVLSRPPAISLPVLTPPKFLDFLKQYLPKAHTSSIVDAPQSPIPVEQFSQTQDQPASLAAEPTEAQLAEIRAQQEWEEWRQIRNSYFQLKASGSEEILEPAYGNPSDSAVLADRILKTSLDEGVNPAVVFAWINFQQTKESHGLTVDRLLTPNEWAEGIRLKIQDDKAQGLEQDFSWFAPGNRVDNVLALVSLVKHGRTPIRLKESAARIDQLFKSGDSAVIDLGDGLSMVYALHKGEGLGEELVKSLVNEQQKPRLVNPNSSPIIGTPLEELITKHLGPRGNVNFWVNRISIESTFNPGAENGPHVGLLQINVDLHQALIIRTLGIDASNYNPGELRE